MSRIVLNDTIDQHKDDKLVKIIMEYDNGNRKYIEGDDVEKWQRAVNSAIVNSYVHGSDIQSILKSITWKKL